MALRRLVWLLALAAAGAAHAGTPSPFDLAGPTLEAKISRSGTTLPAAQVPNLAAGDRIWIKADLPPTQSVHYLMVLAFLSGSTNPPPEEWFFACKTWKNNCLRDGLTVTVPDGAQQVLLFLAPETSGDLRTLVSAVRGRPGAFVRASQDLNQAALDRSRLERYLAVIHSLEGGDPAVLKQTAPLLARSLAIKVDDKCLDRIPELQAPCLMQGQEALILNDGHSTSIVQALTSGPDADLLLSVSATPQAGYGYYSPYIASVLDIARILDSFRTALYQYIPALATHKGDKLSLALNTAPSFYEPKSVLVVGLPAVEQPQLPPLRAVEPKDIYCASRTSLVLPVEGAPLAFSTGYAHDISLSITGADGKTIALPAKADAAQGGYAVDTSGLRGVALGETVRASLQGYWGFDPYQGPAFTLRNAHAKSWALAPSDAGSLIVGRQDTVHLKADSVSCVDDIMLKDPAGKELKAEWKALGNGEVEVKLPLQDTQPGAMTLLVSQYGASQPEPITLQAFADAGHLDGFSLHAGDSQGTLKGTRLDEVAGLTMSGISFLPGDLKTSNGSDELRMVAQDAPAAAALKPDASVAAKATLKDGRVLPVSASIDAPRPRVALIGKSMQQSVSSGDSNIQLANENELPQDAKLTFALRAQVPAKFARDQSIEVATADESFSAVLSLANGGLRLSDAKVALAVLDPAKAFGPSAFGPLRFRVQVNGVAGDWQPLATLVRLPALKDLKCPASADLACKLSGTDLYLVDSIASDPQFTNPVSVPDGFTGYALAVPRPSDGQLYVKLRDDPAVVNTAVLAVQQVPPPPDPVKPSASAAPAGGSTAAAAASTAAAPPSTPAVQTNAPQPPAAPPAPPATAPAPQSAAPADAAVPAAHSS